MKLATIITMEDILIVKDKMSQLKNKKIKIVIFLKMRNNICQLKI